MNPLVSIICLCYNHQRFVKEAVCSAIQQTYPNIEIIVVDDGSMDGSTQAIKEILKDHPSISFIDLKTNRGNCAAFNLGLSVAKGKYIIDFATDDVMLPNRVAKQVSFFEQLSLGFGVIFSDAEYINEEGHHLRYHYRRDKNGKLKQIIPQSDIYSDLLGNYIISPPTMMIKREVLDSLGGYDEKLAYEDFDFWVRSSRKYKYAYQDECLTKVRIVKNSHASSHYKVGDAKLYSTYVVCKKAKKLNVDKKDELALIKRVKYEIRHAVFSANYKEAILFFKMLEELEGIHGIYRFYAVINRHQLTLTFFRKLYLKLRYNQDL